MVIGYLVCGVLMFVIWAAVGIHLKYRGHRMSWPSMWVISFFAGVLWPIALAWIVIYNVSSQYD